MTNIYNLYFLSHFLNEIRNTILFCFKKNENNKKSLFHTDFRKARVAGFEPANDGIRIRCLTTWRYPIKKTGLAGFEPANAGVKVLCLTAWR